MITVVVVATLLVQNLTRRTIAIEPVSVPKELAENGYTPDVAARRLRDAVNVFVAQAQTSMKGPEIALRGDVPDIVVHRWDLDRQHRRGDPRLPAQQPPPEHLR